MPDNRAYRAPSARGCTRAASCADRWRAVSTILPPFKSQAPLAGVAAADRFAQSAFTRLNAQLPAHYSPQSGFQGFRAVQYTDGETGITYAMLLPQRRPKAVQPDADQVQFRQPRAAPRSPRVDPQHAQDRYIERSADPDSNGAWYAWTIACRYLGAPVDRYTG